MSDHHRLIFLSSLRSLLCVALCLKAPATNSASCKGLATVAWGARPPPRVRDRAKFSARTFGARRAVLTYFEAVLKLL